MKKWLLGIVCLIFAVTLGIVMHDKNNVGRLGFLTTDGSGVAMNPYATEAVVKCEWKDGVVPKYTSLPVELKGKMNSEGNVCTEATVTEYHYTQGVSDTADAYYEVISKGWQEGFEDLFVDIYAYLNDESDVTVDGTILSTILKEIHGQQKYGTLQDIVTDALALCKSIQDGEPKDELNKTAYEVYNSFYSWLHNVSIYEFLETHEKN